MQAPTSLTDFMLEYLVGQLNRKVESISTKSSLLPHGQGVLLVSGRCEFAFPPAKEDLEHKSPISSVRALPTKLLVVIKRWMILPTQLTVAIVICTELSAISKR